MGIEGLFTYVRCKIPEAIKDLAVEDMLNDIRDEKNLTGKSPTILINLWTFSGYFEENTLALIFGGRPSLAKKEFENFLGQLKDAGARLLFLFKKPLIFFEEKFIDRRNLEYCQGLKFINLLETMNTCQLYDKLNSSYKYFYPYISSAVTLYQSAQKFGEFRGNEYLIGNQAIGHVELANKENAFAIIGLDTYYLLYEGNWKFWRATHSGKNNMSFQEFDKKVIMDRLSLTYEQFRLFAMLRGTNKLSLEKKDVVESFFNNSPPTHKKSEIFERIFEFIKTIEFPINRATFQNITEIIFGKIDLEVVDEFELSLKSLKTFTLLDETESSLDKDVMNVIRNQPMSISERILYNRPLDVFNNYLDVSANDMKSLKDLTLPWIRRTMGLLLKHIDGPKSRPFLSRIDEHLWEKIEIEPLYPNFEIPSLKQLSTGELSISKKFQILTFLIDGVVDEKILKRIPIDYMFHVIVLVHLLKNNSLEFFEAIAMIKMLVDVQQGNVPATFVNPMFVNVRAFRVSRLYGSQCESLIGCFTSVGLQDLIPDIKLDYAHFQNIYNAQAPELEDKDENFVTQLLLIISD